MERIQKTMKLIQKVLMYYLRVQIGKQKFRGKLLISINCNDGGIGNVSVDVQQNFNEKTIDGIN